MLPDFMIRLALLPPLVLSLLCFVVAWLGSKPGRANVLDWLSRRWNWLVPAIAEARVTQKLEEGGSRQDQVCFETRVARQRFWVPEWLWTKKPARVTQRKWPERLWTKGLAWLTLIVSGVLLGLSLYLLVNFKWSSAIKGKWDIFPDSLYNFSVDFYVDGLSLWFILLANVIAVAASWHLAAEISSNKPEAAHEAEMMHHPAFLLGSLNGFHCSMILVPTLANLIAMWIGIELTTLASALVIGFKGTPAAWEAAWKYLVMTSAGIVLALLGTVFLDHGIPSGLQDAKLNWKYVMDLAMGPICSHEKDKYLGLPFVMLGFLFALVGYGTKAGLAPLHTWLPDGHGEAPSAISALLSGVLLKLALYAILRFAMITNAALITKATPMADEAKALMAKATLMANAALITKATPMADEAKALMAKATLMAEVAAVNLAFPSALLLGAGVLSLVVATPFILKSNKFKRVLAYHSVEHMGIICVGLGIGGRLAIAGALLHTLNHAATKALMFLAYGNVERRYKALKDENIAGIMHKMPSTAIFLALAGLALVGTPPFSIFFSEVMILWGALEQFLSGAGPLPNWAVILGIALFLLTTTLIFFGLVRHLSEHLLTPWDPRRRADPGRDKGKTDDRSQQAQHVDIEGANPGPDKNKPDGSAEAATASVGEEPARRKADDSGTYLKRWLNKLWRLVLLNDLWPLVLLGLLVLPLAFVFPQLMDLLQDCMTLLTTLGPVSGPRECVQ
jgi:hydrogenase-4 component F